MVVADDSRESAGALQYALSHAVMDNDTLILLHVENAAAPTKNALGALFKTQISPANNPRLGGVSSKSASSAEGGSVGGRGGGGGGEVDFLDGMKRACAAAKPKLKVAVEKVEVAEGKDKAAVIVAHSADTNVELLIIGQKKNALSKSILGMLSLRHSLATISIGLEPVELGKNTYRCRVQCAAKGPRPRYPRVWKTKKRIGTFSKSLKLVECIKGLSNVKEEVYGALDSFVAWDLEFPLITVKKALKSLENEKDWKRIIQVTKWMLSKGQGRTMGTYYMLLNALAEDGRLDEAEELWQTIFSQNIESMPRMFFERMISIYYYRDMHEKMFEIFADMDELGINPTVSIVTMMGNVFKKLNMLDKYEKLKRKYPPPKWEYQFIKGKRVKVRSKPINETEGNSEENNSSKYSDETEGNSEEDNSDVEASSDALELPENTEVSTDNCDEKNNLYLPETTYSHKTD